MSGSSAWLSPDNSPTNEAVSQDDLFAVLGGVKVYGPTRALDGATMHVRGGEIHALIGENGSGKSTMIKVLSGVIALDQGTVLADGKPCILGSPRAAHSAGISTVFQETLVVEELSVIDNTLLGLDGIVRRGMRQSDARQRAEETLLELGVQGDSLDAPVWTLSISQRQIVTIARALMRPWRVLLLDEATSALDIGDRERFFELLIRKRASDSAVIFVSHRMDEIRQIADRVTVLRSGRSVASLTGTEATPDRLVALMTAGSDVGQAQSKTSARVGGMSPVTTEEHALSIRGLGLRAGSPSIDLELRPGEVLGLAGLEGQGQDQLLRCLAGHERPSKGSVVVRGPDDARTISGARAALRAGIAYVPADRKREAIFGPLSVLDNLMLPTLSSYSRAGILGSRRVRTRAKQLVENLKVQPPLLHVQAGRLSGGNQQKVVLGRWLAIQPRVLLLNDPLRGVDIAVRSEVCQLFRDLAARGMAILFFSTEIDELMLACDAVCVMRDQAISRRLERGEMSQRSIIDAMFGQSNVSSEPSQ